MYVILSRVAKDVYVCVKIFVIIICVHLHYYVLVILSSILLRMHMCV